MGRRGRTVPGAALSRFGGPMMRAVVVSLALLLSATAHAQAPDPAAVQRGAYVFAVAGCATCHTAVEGTQRGPVGGGGRALRTPFGTFYGPNITPHPTQGIGRWSEADFIRAVREGVRPDGAY